MAKSPPRKTARSTEVRTVLKDDPTPSTPAISFGIVFDINGTAVPISSEDITKIKEQGVKMELPNPVVLGSIDDLLAWLDKTFGVTFPTDTGIGWLNDIIKKVTSMVFTVIVFKLEIPGSTAPDQNTRYALQIGGQFSGEPLYIVPGLKSLGIRGGVFGVSNIPPALT
jgi:hypothetical protein